jgi:hypothetical protein
MNAAPSSHLNGRLSRRVLLGSLAASTAGALLSACGDTRSPTATATIVATPTSVPSVATATAQPPSTPLPTATPLVVITPASAPAPAPAPAVTELATWTDPRRLVQLRFPRTWQTSVADRRPDNILELGMPDRRAGLYDTLVLWLDLHDPQRGTLDAEVQLIRDDLTAGTPYVASMQMITDLTVGEEPGKSFAFTLTPSFNPTIHNGWQNVVVNHVGREFVIDALRRPTSGATLSAEIDAVIASLRFLT